MARVFFAADVHGSEKCFMKFLNAGKFYNADVLIMGGDLTGKMVVPIIEQLDGSFECQYRGRNWRARNRDELQGLEKDIRFSGFYPYLTNADEVKELDADKAKVDELFLRVMNETMERWLKIAEERLRNTGVKCYILPGNDDHLVIDSIFKKFEYVVNPEAGIVNIDQHHEMISTGYTNLTPWLAPRDIPEEELAKKIEAMAKQVRDMSNCIFNFHCPPINSNLDLAPQLDKDMRPVVGPGGQQLIAAGSTAVRDAIMKFQPLLGLHGHIHEAKGCVKLGHTLCVNPGSDYVEGILQGILISLDRKGIKNYQLTSG